MHCNVAMSLDGSQCTQFHFLYDLFLAVTGYSVHAINAVLSGVCAFYTMIGGVKAVVWTDVVQAFVMIASSFVVVVIGESSQLIY